MLILLSSGSRPRYLQDVLRTMAMPLGTFLQFRYDSDWVGSDVIERIKDGSIIGEAALIAYADQAAAGAEGAPVDVVPLRLARIASASLPGKTVSITFEAGNIAFSEKLDSFNADLANLSKGLPAWKAGKPKGLYCATMSSKPKGIDESSDLANWEKLVGQLAPRVDFNAQETFVTALGFFTRQELQELGARVGYSRWPSSCGADQSRDLVLYHYHPNKAPDTWLLRAETGDGLSLRSNSLALLDSRYDLKRFTFHTGDPPVGKQSTWIRVTVEGANAARQVDIEMSVFVRSNFWKRLGLAAIVAIGLAGSQLVPLVTRNDLSDAEKVASGMVAFLLAFVVGVAAAWGLRRGV